MGQSEWRNAFKEKNGREPSLDEFKQAKKNGFALPKTDLPNEADLKAWIRGFESINHRRPTVEEVKQQKNLAENPVDETATNQEQTPGNQPSQPVQPVQVTQPAEPIQQEAEQFDRRRQQKPAQPDDAGQEGGNNHRNGKKKSSKKRKWVIFLLAVAAVLIALVSYGYNYYSYANSLDRAATALKTYDKDKYQNITEWSDSHKKMTTADLTPLANYMQDQKMSKSDTEDWIKKSGKGVRFVRDGQTLLIFPHYTLEMDPVDLTVNTNQSGLSISVNGKVLTDKSDSDYSEMLKHQAPGLYNFTAQGNLNGQNVNTQSSDYYGDNSSDTVDLNIKTVSFTVESNIDGGDVYVAGNKAGTISNGKADIKNVAVTKGAKVYVKSGSGSDAITTSSKSLSSIDDGDTVDLDSDSILSNSDAEDQLNDMASALTSYASSDDTPSGLGDIFNGGSSNKSYQDFSQMIHRNRYAASRNANTINFGDISVDQVSAKSKKNADVTFEIKEDFNYTSDTDPDKHTSGTKTQRFQLIAHMVYNSSKGKWLVDSIDPNQKKLSDDDNVN
ncbi:hypothetical protein [Fructobacillus evanidus]|uniref:Contains N-terminal Zn ribbon domain (YvbJ) n=1 Tax=Fructobacillus evanidus TaxID=3064281 RepID=A0ABM9MTZ9_9LACO|nr:Uncharacterized protein YvbJ [Fructobacillus sp. LMG 32999]CAK1238975.1 Uncharacterized protein YvbJ [Fructobacillus sp. LMG 32999]CAK1239830.1 Uncharacterized protein YvbJ [Fructobacillus sp. LMG 32999]CAK1244877.1 Uncharacterized protein YvbJ [Fructobacillus sp. LMG 32999]CAK1244976.1 Uncharacterized protein YvbJ [Fructobacillus sp. LMG 32999]